MMHLDEEVKPVAQISLLLNWRHTVEPLEEEFLLLGGRWKHVLRLKMLSSSFGQEERRWGGQDYRISERGERVSVGLGLGVVRRETQEEGTNIGWGLQRTTLVWAAEAATV